MDYRQPSEWVILTRDSKKSFGEFEIPLLTKEEELKLYFHDKDAEAHFSKIKRLWQLACPYCDKSSFKDLVEMKNHLKEDHKLFFW